MKRPFEQSPYLFAGARRSRLLLVMVLRKVVGLLLLLLLAPLQLKVHLRRSRDSDVFTVSEQVGS